MGHLNYPLDSAFGGTCCVSDLPVTHAILAHVLHEFFTFVFGHLTLSRLADKASDCPY